MKYLKLLLVVSVIGIQIAAFAYAPDNGDKITVCHIPPGNPENMHEIDISVNALNAHLAHGDNVGGCQAVIAVGSGSRVN